MDHHDDSHPAGGIGDPARAQCLSGHFSPRKRVRYLPVTLAERLGDVAMRRKSLIPVYVVGVFVVLPIMGIVVL